MTSRLWSGATLGFWVMLGMLPARSAVAQALTAPEAVANLLFPDGLTAMPKTLGPGRVTYRGNTIAGKPERTVLSISRSRADPCLFEAFFIEAPAPAGNSAVAVTTAYVASIDLRRLDQAAFRPDGKPAGGAQVVLRAKDLYCTRSIILEQTPKLSIEESCVDAIDDGIPAQDRQRKSEASMSCGSPAAGDG